jgi:hypothetical protein
MVMPIETQNLDDLHVDRHIVEQPQTPQRIGDDEMLDLFVLRQMQELIVWPRIFPTL